MKFAIKVFLAALAIVAFATITKLCFSSYLPNPNRGLNDVAALKSVDNLFIGSSMFRKGLSLKCLQAELGDSVYILSYNGNQPFQIAEEVRYLIDGRLKIKNLYIDMYAFSAAAEPKISDVRLIWDFDLRGKLSIFSDTIGYSSDKIADTYFFFVTSNNEYFATYPISNYFISKRYNRGAGSMESYAAGMTQDQVKSLNLDFLSNVQPQLNSIQVKAIKELVALARKNDINVSFIDTIKFVSVYASDKYARLMSEYETLLKSLNCPYIRILEEQISRDPSNFSDGVHLSGKGQQAFTKILCRRIQSSGNPQRNLSK